MRRMVFLLLLLLGLGGFLRFYHLRQRGVIYVDGAYYVLRAEYIKRGILPYLSYLFRAHSIPLEEKEKKNNALYHYLREPNQGLPITSDFNQDKDLHSFLIAWVSLLFGCSTVQSALLSQALFGTLNILLVFALVLLLFQNSRMALLSGLFYAIFPLSLWYSRSALSEEGAIFFCLLAFVGMVWSVRSKIPLFWYCLTGIFLGCAFGMNGRMGAAVGLSFLSFCLLLWEEERGKVRGIGLFKRMTGRIWLCGFFSTLFFGLILGVIELPYYLIYLQLKMHGKDLPMVMSYWARVLIDSRMVTHGLDLGFDNLTFFYALRYLTGITCTVLVVGSLAGLALKWIRVRSIRMDLVLG